MIMAMSASTFDTNVNNRRKKTEKHKKWSEEKILFRI